MNILDKIEWYFTAKLGMVHHELREEKSIRHTKQTTVNSLPFTVHISPVWMDTVKNYLIRFVGLRSLPMKFLVHLTKSKQL
jgi:hypothetical protein